MSEMKLMDLARVVYSVANDDYIDEHGSMRVDFAGGTEEETRRSYGWYGVIQFNPFDNDNYIFIIGSFGGEANTWLYTISEYDPRIGDFCKTQLHYDIRHGCNDEAYINCIARMLADVFERNEGGVPDVITVEVNDN